MSRTYLMHVVNICDCLTLFPLILAAYLTVYGVHPFSPTTVVENARAKIVVVNVGGGYGVHNDLQVVVAAPWSDAEGRLFLLERPRVSYWWVYQWPDVTPATLAASDTVPVCYFINGSDAVVDVDCDSVKWRAFGSNLQQYTLFLFLVCFAAIFVMHLASLMVATFRTTLDRLEAVIDDEDCKNFANPIRIDIEGGPLNAKLVG